MNWLMTDSSRYHLEQDQITKQYDFIDKLTYKHSVIVHYLIVVSTDIMDAVSQCACLNCPFWWSQYFSQGRNYTLGEDKIRL